VSVFETVELDLPDRREGKVRVSYRLPPDARGEDRRLFVTTDRLSAFDRIITSVPYKGQVLNQLSAWWFERTAGVVANHLVAVPDPNATIGREARPLPVEVVVRGAITGVTATSLWQLYAAGARTVYGHRLPDGLAKNALLPTPLVTPTTKPAAGSNLHDEPLSERDVVERGLVDDTRWQEVTAAARALFAVGQAVSADAGLILADTKYEFGLAPDGALLLIDEVHTPDSSRLWLAETYDERLAAGAEPDSLDKEFVRRVLADVGYRGDGPPPRLAADVIAATTARYVDAYQRITGGSFEPGAYPVGPRLDAAVAALVAPAGGLP
jgi:phosphoribosylaminoimidazole-succinocarboxamide synthase